MGQWIILGCPGHQSESGNFSSLTIIGAYTIPRRMIGVITRHSCRLELLSHHLHVYLISGAEIQQPEQLFPFQDCT